MSNWEYLFENKQILEEIVYNDENCKDLVTAYCKRMKEIDASFDEVLFQKKIRDYKENTNPWKPVKLL